MTEEKKDYTPEEWEQDVKDKITEFVSNMLSVSKECNMGTRYFKEVKEQFEDHTDYDQDKVNGAELRIVFNFVEPLDLNKVNLV